MCGVVTAYKSKMALATLTLVHHTISVLHWSMLMELCHLAIVFFFFIYLFYCQQSCDTNPVHQLKISGQARWLLSQTRSDSHRSITTASSTFECPPFHTLLHVFLPKKELHFDQGSIYIHIDNPSTLCLKHITSVLSWYAVPIRSQQMYFKGRRKGGKRGFQRRVPTLHLFPQHLFLAERAFSSDFALQRLCAVTQEFTQTVINPPSLSTWLTWLLRTGLVEDIATSQSCYCFPGSLRGWDRNVPVLTHPPASLSLLYFFPLPY